MTERPNSPEARSWITKADRWWEARKAGLRLPEHLTPEERAQGNFKRPKEVARG